MFFIKWLEVTSRMDVKEFDLMNLTASDFTAELAIPHTMYTAFLDKYHSKNKSDLVEEESGIRFSPAVYFKKKL